MVRFPALGRRPLAALTAAALTVSGILVAGPAPAAPNHTTVVGAVPSSLTPNIVDGTVFAIHDAGSKVVVGGSFTGVQNRNSDVTIARKYVLAFDKATGQVDTAFAPVVDSEVYDILAGPTAGTVYLAGKFNTVNGTSRRKLALLNLANGSVVTSFPNLNFNGLVNDIAKVGSRLLVGGIFTTAATQPRNGLASLDAVTGVVDNYLTASLTGHHNYDGISGASAGVGAEKMAVSPDGTQLVVIGNFKKANGVLHDQVVRITLGGSAATVSSWNTNRYEPRCAYKSFDSYVRDVSFSPNGSYFVIVTTGTAYAGTLCDAAARWETSSTGTTVQPTWVAYTGGDTFLSVGITEQAVYVGGHFRWLNNTSATNSAYPGAVARPSIAALDPLNGLPLSWNPGRHPRGYGVAELLVTPQGIWLGSDQPWIGNFQYRRERIAFFPLSGGAAPHSTATATLPGRVYQAGFSSGSVNAVQRRSYDGTSAVGAATPVANPDGTTWSTAKSAFWAGGTLFYGMSGALWRRTFDGTTFGKPTRVDPYHDALWDTVVTGSGPEGQTYAGNTVSFYPEIANMTGMFYTNGRLYYTLTGQNGLFWRWFNPDSGTVGADKFTVAGATGFADSGGVFVAGSRIYMVSRSLGNLSSANWVNGAPSGSWTVRSGPAQGGVDWRTKAIFVGP
ncbi:hypothetical protein [Micromonospora sp. ATCC 39149]|uniref:Delta-60 repeat domain-containing protein n=1 Tax=Micromonospora carbonacea TaxID=47853 RepID=A0A7D6C5T9_9ACTN|nr:hypothetical protein [Micromonospora sp. ATCC 39149]QLJ98564.1 hypothetical protein HZU44_28665 [Micromonospora carbonacea]